MISMLQALVRAFRERMAHLEDGIARLDELNKSGQWRCCRRR